MTCLILPGDQAVYKDRVLYISRGAPLRDDMLFTARRGDYRGSLLILYSMCLLENEMRGR